jgi:hypothetical protein
MAEADRSWAVRKKAVELAKLKSATTMPVK